MPKYNNTDMMIKISALLKDHAPELPFKALALQVFVFSHASHSYRILAP